MRVEIGTDLHGNDTEATIIRCMHDAHDALACNIEQMFARGALIWPASRQTSDTLSQGWMPLPIRSMHPLPGQLTRKVTQSTNVNCSLSLQRSASNLSLRLNKCIRTPSSYPLNLAALRSMHAILPGITMRGHADLNGDTKSKVHAWATSPPPPSISGQYKHRRPTRSNTIEDVAEAMEAAGHSLIQLEDETELMHILAAASSTLQIPVNADNVVCSGFAKQVTRNFTHGIPMEHIIGIILWIPGTTGTRLEALTTTDTKKKESTHIAAQVLFIRQDHIMQMFHP